MSRTLIALSREELHEVVRGAISEALKAQEERSGATALLNRLGLARALNVSPSHVDALRRNPGFPEVRRLGKAPRFRLGAVLAWLEQADAKTPGASP